MMTTEAALPNPAAAPAGYADPAALAARGRTTPLADPRAGKYLAFQVGAEDLAIPVLKVREIIGLQDITAVPQTPDYVRGVFNLRGKVVPVIDLRRKFGLPATEATPRTCIIVVDTAIDGRTLQMGIMVDGVSEVLMLTGADIENTPDFGDGSKTSYLLGVAKSKGTVKLLLDIDATLTAAAELSGMAELLTNGPAA
jgi:purine-binding chemotaxis protein CheW